MYVRFRNPKHEDKIAVFIYFMILCASVLTVVLTQLIRQ